MNKRGLIVAVLVAIVCLFIWDAMNGMQTGVNFEQNLRQNGLALAIWGAIAQNIAYAIVTGLTIFISYKITVIVDEKGYL